MHSKSDAIMQDIEDSQCEAPPGISRQQESKDVQLQSKDAAEEEQQQAKAATKAAAKKAKKQKQKAKKQQAQGLTPSCSEPDTSAPQSPETVSPAVQAAELQSPGLADLETEPSNSGHTQSGSVSNILVSNSERQDDGAMLPLFRCPITQVSFQLCELRLVCVLTRTVRRAAFAMFS